MSVRAVACVGLIVVTIAPITPLRAQRTKDQARLVFTIAAGYVGGADLWAVARQPFGNFNSADTLALTRQIRSIIGVSFGGAYFPGEHLGFAGEAFLLGVGTEDSCQEAVSSGDPRTAAVCNSLLGRQKAATAVALTAGTILRFNSRRLLSPYARLNVGLLFTNESSIRTNGQFIDANGPVDVIIYSDDHNSRVSGAFALAGGITAAVAGGYQLRWELRDNIVGVQRVTAATARTGLVPSHDLVYKHLPSFTFGLEIVLERRRGRRY
jgi:hypothetical protein